MKQFHSLAILLTLLVGLMLGGAAIAAEHAGEAADSGSTAEHSEEMTSHDKSSNGEEHGGEPIKAEEDSGEDGDSSEHPGS